MYQTRQSTEASRSSNETLREQPRKYNTETIYIPREPVKIQKQEGGIEKVPVIFAYDASLPDELQLTVGEQIWLLKRYDDGWGLGVKDNGDKGVFPLVCVVSDEEPGDERGEIKKRVSSMMTVKA